MRYIILVILLCVLQSCCSSRVTDYVTKSDTCYITKVNVDSIYLHDSISVNTYRDSDTIVKVITNHRNHYHYRTSVDTIYKVKTDTVYTNYAYNTHTSRSMKRDLSLIFFILLIIIIVYVGFSFRSRR